MLWAMGRCESTPFVWSNFGPGHPKLRCRLRHPVEIGELGVAPIRATKNVLLRLAGSDPTSGYVEMAVRELARERVIYGSDVGAEFCLAGGQGGRRQHL